MFVLSHYGQQTHGSESTDSHGGALVGSLDVSRPMIVLQLSVIVLLPVGIRLLLFRSLPSQPARHLVSLPFSASLP